MLELLFKYPPDQWQRGAVELAVSWPAFALAAAVIAVAVAWLLGYARLPQRRGGGTAWRERTVLIALRTALLAAIAFGLLVPQLVVPVAKPERGRVAVLIDDSLSMRTADEGDAARADDVLRKFAPGDGDVARRLESRFEPEYFRFAGDTAPLRSASELAFAGGRSDLAGALRRTFAALDGALPAALVVVSDGGDDGVEPLASALAPLRAAGVPVYTVGVGAERFERDVEISAVRVPRDVLAGDSIEVEVTIRHRGYAGEAVRLVVEDDSLIIAERELVVPQDRDRSVVRVQLELKDAGPHELVFRLPVRPGEVLSDNNQDRAVVNVRGERIQGLHLEGEPRFEVKFGRRAVADDEHIRLVSLVRTSDNKLYRLGVASKEELAAGFPTTAEDLFPFHVVILGSIEASRLSVEQQQLLVDFVGRRGGGLLLLGGRRAFAEGGYGGSRLAALMPVVLGPRAAAFRSSVKIEPAPLASRHPVLRMIDDALWDRLPPLTVVNPIRRVKPGAVLLLHALDASDQPLVVLAAHRYGRGAVAALPVRDTWRWQMHSTVPLEDQTHETLWRRLLRWLAGAAGGRVQLALSSGSGVVGQPVRVVADVKDAAHRPLANARVRLTVDTPLGDRLERDLDWQAVVEGRYEAGFTPGESGRYDLRVSLLEGERTAAEATAHLYASAAGREPFEAELDAALLKHIAGETGGRYYDLDDAVDLVDAIAPSQGGRTVIERLPLWDLPALYLLIVVLACTEWFYRRRRGLR